ncbi:MAG: MurR/RpiR family transcriptional regulator [Clostridiales bacterium]|nr:MurR/RpiR family transcriptional regulator [Clostridiales bacterium]
MPLIRDLKDAKTLTEREAGIRNYLLEHPEHIMSMSCQDLGSATFTSAATVTRFCKKFGCKGYPEFKLRFLNEVAAGQTMEEASAVQLSERENMVSLLQKVNDVQAQALETTRKALSLSQLLRVQRLLLIHPYIDFYAYDTNLHLARYASSFFSMRVNWRLRIPSPTFRCSAPCPPNQAIWPSSSATPGRTAA